MDEPPNNERRWVLATKVAMILWVAFVAIGVVLGPGAVFVVFYVLLFVGSIVGLPWLIFRRCKFSLAHLMTALFVYGVALQLSLDPDEPDRTIRTIGIAVMHALAIALGLFVGARAAAKANAERRKARWMYFLSGLISPVGAVTSVLELRRHYSIAGWMGAIAVWSVTAIAIIVLLWVVLGHGWQQDTEK